MRRSPFHSTMLAIAGAGVTLGLGTGPVVPAATASTTAEAPPAYKYWGYYHGTGDDWRFSMVGAHEYVPKDGAVEGWRYGLDTGGGRPPRTTPDFDSICGDQTASAGNKLVAVVIDYGTQEEAEAGDETPPARGACADMPTDASGQEVLQSVANLTMGEAGVASIDGYPSVPTTESFPDADIPTSEPTVELALADDAAADEPADEGDDGPPWALIGVGAVAVVIAGGAVVVARRRG